MKKIFFLSPLITLLLLANTGNAQNAQDASVHFLKDDRPGFTVEYPFPERMVADALTLRLALLGKSKTQKGFEWYQGSEWPEIAPGHLDVYTKVDGKGNKCTVYMLVSKGYDNYVSSATDPEIANKLKAFLNSLTPAIMEMQHRENIAIQEEGLRKTEKAFNDSKSDLDRLISERDKLERKIADQKSETSKRESSWIAEKAKLEQMKSGK